MSPLRALVAHIAALVLLVVAIALIVLHVRNTAPIEVVVDTATTTMESFATSTPELVATSTAATTTPRVATSTRATTTVQTAKKPGNTATKSSSPTPPPPPNQISRIENPYPGSPLPFETVNVEVRPAIVNIFCSTNGGGSLKPITGSGVIIDPRGVVLTNAHVAQYVLLSQVEQSKLRCEVRTGAPAVAKWLPMVMYIPPVWVEQHASEITQSGVLGTGEHDYALLYLAATIDGTPLTAPVPHLPIDTRDAVAFVDDYVLVASYPAELVGGSVVQNNFYPVTSITTVRRLMTFRTGSPDALSLGGVIQAQAGSSGGAVVNPWLRVVGLVTTTSDGATTAERDLNAISTAYISRDFAAQSGRTLAEELSVHPKERVQDFTRNHALRLAELLIKEILGN